MDEYSRILLKEMVAEIGEDRVQPLPSDFSCPLNKDVEGFLKQKAACIIAAQCSSEVEI